MTTTAFRLAVFAALAAAPLTVTAQATSTGATQESMAGHHGMSAWKEMDAFHTLMAATWHPASQKNDLAPLREKVKEMAKAAETWSASTAPAMAHGCGTDAVTKAAAKVATDSKALALLVESGAGDAKLKESLKALHDTFEIAEKACGGHGGHP